MASETIYDHPLYYDILFGWDRTPEADFYQATFRRCGVRPDELVLEVACGTGQVARRLAKRGLRLHGMDSAPAMLAFLRAQAAHEGVRVDVLRASMESFGGPDPDLYGAAYNPMSSFRLLHDDASAEAHLRAISEALRPGGVYVLDLETCAVEDAAPTTTDEEWEMERDGVTVRATDDAVHVKDGAGERVLAWGAEIHLRTYTPRTFAGRVAAVPELTIESWHPESGCNPEGVSLFDVPGHPGPGEPGRAMVVLRRS